MENTEQKNSKWENPYISLLSNMEEYIFNGSNLGLEKTYISQIRKKANSFDKVFCEIGSGSGAHLVELAKQNPNTLCVGFEIRFKRAYKTAEKANKIKLNNLLVIRASANFIPDIFTANSLDALYINFPDPWSKKRWLKNRMINEVFLEKLRETLKPNSYLSYKTDHKEYFMASNQLISTLNYFEIVEYTEDLHKSEFVSCNIKTEFEGLFLSKSLPIYFLKAILKK